MLCKSFGPPESLVVEDVPSPTPGPGEVVLSVKAASVNFPDVLIIQNKYQFKPPLPFSPGSEMAGVVKSVGDGVTGFTPGDAVMAITTYGAFAEEVKTEARRLLPIPAGMEFATAAAFGLTYATSEHALCDRGLKAGETPWCPAPAASPRCHRDRQDPRRAASPAPPTTSSRCARTRRRRHDQLRHHRGSARAIGNHQRPWPDVVYDPVGGPYTEPVLRSIAWRGRLLVVGFAAGEIPKIPLNLTLLKGCAIVGVFWGEFTKREPESFAAAMSKLSRWYGEGRLKPHISATLPLERASEALTLMAERKVKGKVVLTVG